MCTAVGIHKSNFSFVRRGKLDELKCRTKSFVGRCFAPHPAGQATVLPTHPPCWLRGACCLIPRTPHPLWALLPHRNFSGTPSFIFFLKKISLRRSAYGFSGEACWSCMGQFFSASMPMTHFGWMLSHKVRSEEVQQTVWDFATTNRTTVQTLQLCISFYESALFITGMDCMKLQQDLRFNNKRFISHCSLRQDWQADANKLQSKIAMYPRATFIAQ